MKRFFSILLLIALSVQCLHAETTLLPYEKSKPSGNMITGFDGVTPISFIIEGGCNINMYSGTVSWNSRLLDSLKQSQNTVINDVYNSAMGFSPHFAFGLDVPIDEKVGLTFRVGWDRKYISNEVDGTFPILNSANTSTVKSIWEKSVDYASYSIDFRYNVIEQLSVNLGAVIDVVSRDKETTKWESSNAPLNQTGFFPQLTSWEDNMYYDETMIRDNPLTHKTRFGLELGLDYKIPLMERWTIVPYVRFQYFLTDFMKENKVVLTDSDEEPIYGTNTNTNWLYSITDTKLNTFQVGIALWFNFEKKK